MCSCQACHSLSHEAPGLQMGPLYLRAMDAIYSVSPNTLFLVEGCGQTAFPGINWGDGFVTDKSLISQYGLSDANLFFGPLLAKPYLNQVGISPHVYPPSVSYATTVRLPSKCGPFAGHASHPKQRPGSHPLRSSPQRFRMCMAGSRAEVLLLLLLPSCCATNVEGMPVRLVSDSLAWVQNYDGSGLWWRMYNSFGYLNTVGYSGHIFPVVMVRW